MRTYRPVRWPCYIWWKDELKPRRKYLLFGPRNQGKRTASNYGFLIVAKNGTPSWTIEQEKYESRYWTLYGFGLWYLFCRLFYPTGLCRVECASRAQEIRAKWKFHFDQFYFTANHPPSWMADPNRWAEEQARIYARSIHGAKNYPWFTAAGWDEERVYQEILRHL